MTDRLVFNKSSYSGVNSDCVEVAHLPVIFRKSSYSGQAPNCVEVAHLPTIFRTSSYTGVNGNCVEVADLPCGAAVRDSKHPDAGYLALPAAEWAAFLSATQAGEL